MSNEKAELGMDQEGVRPTAASLINSKNHRPGRELDVLIAETVMGWKYEARFPGDVAGYFVAPTARYISEEWPAFSTDISAAWLVVEKMREDHRCWVDLQSSGLDPKLWKVSIQKAHATNATGKVVEASFSAPEAICLAALRALDA